MVTDAPDPPGHVAVYLGKVQDHGIAVMLKTPHLSISTAAAAFSGALGTRSATMSLSWFWVPSVRGSFLGQV